MSPQEDWDDDLDLAALAERLDADLNCVRVRRQRLLKPGRD